MKISHLFYSPWPQLELEQVVPENENETLIALQQGLGRPHKSSQYNIQILFAPIRATIDFEKILPRTILLDSLAHKT